MFATNRYALYYRLIDLAFFCQIIILIDEVANMAAGRSISDGWFYYPFIAVFVTGLVLPSLLIFQRWMRDDLSEMLWQRTAGTVLKLLIVLPLPAMLAFGVAILLGNPLDFTVDPASRLTPERQALLRGFIFPSAAMWMLTPICFTFVFQWHRWRASR